MFHLGIQQTLIDSVSLEHLLLLTHTKSPGGKSLGHLVDVRVVS